MIIGSYRPMVVGKIHDGGITDHEGAKHPGQPCLVLRVATLEEWVTDAKAAGCPPVLFERQLAAMRLADRCYFYEVSVD